MPQTSLALMASSLLSGLILTWPGDLPAPQAHQLAAAPGARHAATGRALRGQTARHRASPAQDGPGGDAFAYGSVLDDLEGCTPFLAIDGDRELDFDTSSGQVVETVIPEAPIRSGGPAETPTRVGTFSTAERTSQVSIVIAGVRRQYTLIIPGDGTQCILALGSADNVNLERSWFGQVSDGPDLDQPAYEHAAAPPVRRQHAPPPRHHPT